MDQIRAIATAAILILRRSIGVEKLRYKLPTFHEQYFLYLRIQSRDKYTFNFSSYELIPDLRYNSTTTI